MSPSEKNCDNIEDDKYVEDCDSMDAAPLHFHAMRIPARLQGTPLSCQQNLRGSFSSSRSRSKPTSRDVSPSGSRTPSNSSTGSTIIDNDILLDRLGLEELLPPPPHEIGVVNFQPPPALSSVNERMSEENLDDCHAFSDLVVSAKIERSGSFTGSREGSVTGGSLQGDASFLETLEEFDEEEEDDDEDNGSGTKRPKSEAERRRFLKRQETQKERAKLEKEVLVVMQEKDEIDKPV
eukprot:CAMPEP_0197833932 /NCGR_PEP_ID=MMETSP1437-20131217/20595_1 /TAXON_ID=49252 ORGANISM="Eucampia antarctica, Strain CCMP1452" /NCGR_SAMPLE_ID=MMETSP1437 /ASSEMBLY_ACC=CAM_ASM_001096 /LENGTH=236 /DNA_ID=CAMNT_0043438267 /DNA_START=82 /DNA_END=792 /DNA_ORIENTATION=+